MIGSAGEITDQLLDAAKALDLDRIFARVDWGGRPPRTRSGGPSPAGPASSLPPSAFRHGDALSADGVGGAAA